MWRAAWSFGLPWTAACRPPFRGGLELGLGACLEPVWGPSEAGLRARLGLVEKS